MKQRMRACLCAAWLVLMSLLSVSAVEQEIAYFPADNIRAGKVELRVSLLQNGAFADLIVDFIPVGPETYHLYSAKLPKKGVHGVGRPTVVEIPETSFVAATGALHIDKEIIDPQAQLPIYTDGPVRAVLPIHLPQGDGLPRTVQVSVTYMSCTQTSCNRPVTNRLLNIILPTHPQGYVRDREHSIKEFVPQPDDSVDAMAQQDEGNIKWTHIDNRIDMQIILQKAQEQQVSVMLNFTGPSCAVCQTMKKTVFLDQRVIAGWNTYQAIEINTDASLDLALWQQEQFNTQARPLYVRMDPDKTFTSWSYVFDGDDEEMMQQYLSFLDGGEGMNQGTGEGLWQFLLLAIGGGLFTLFMPCTYPMIPLTVNFFHKQSHDGKSIVPLACAYALGIVLSFTGLGVFIVFILQSAIATFAGNPWTNLLIALLFIMMGLSLLDVFFLRLPHVLSGYFGSGMGGYFGALLMGCTFAVTAFTCTAPFAGAVLAEGLRSGTVLRPIVGMAVYASAIAIPFFILSLSPKLLKCAPNAGSWLSEIKHVGGIVEIAAAIKFLVICDIAWGWGFFGRSVTLSLWTIASLLIAVYIAGYIRLAGDQKIDQPSAWRVIIAIGWLLLGLWFLIGLLGLQNLGIVESFFPADAVPT